LVGKGKADRPDTSTVATLIRERTRTLKGCLRKEKRRNWGTIEVVSTSGGIREEVRERQSGTMSI